ncbi:MAG: AbrB/MazE/SpoVT family DNA-binding domain-containing protein [Thaumarchaeota archaeon]|nr:AbrB/MazE/SpoVT family DNA-binding domain-containing protein [Nitrososphaerota archaeon]
METIVDERGRVLIPQELRQELGIAEGTVVDLERSEGGIMITPARQKHLSWKELNGIKPRRTAKPEWPTPEEIKSIWG